MFYAGSSTPLVRAIISVEVVSRCVSSYISDILFPGCISSFLYVLEAQWGCHALKIH